MEHPINSQSPGDDAPETVGAAHPPEYISAILDDFSAGRSGRFNHLGHWDDPTVASRGSFREAQRRMHDVVLRLAQVSDSSSLLDVGCGFGGSLEAIAADFDSMTLVGVDIDLRQIALTQGQSFRDGVMLCAADAGSLPLADATFDQVISIEAMWHFPSRASFLNEASRVLVPGGTLAVVDILIQDHRFGGPDLAKVMPALEPGFAPWPEPDATLASIIGDAEAAGLVCTQSIDATENTKPTYLDHADAVNRPAASAFSADESVRLFVDLHMSDQISIVYLGFQKHPLD